MIIKWKLEKSRYEDAILDGFILILLASVFANSLGGLVIATITSFMVSIYLLASPPKFTTSLKTKYFITEFRKRMPK